MKPSCFTAALAAGCIFSACAYIPPQEGITRRVSLDYTATGSNQTARAYLYGNRTVVEFDGSPLFLSIKDETGVAVDYEKVGSYYRLARRLDTFTVWANGSSVTFSSVPTTQVFSALARTPTTTEYKHDSQTDTQLANLLKLSQKQLAEARRILEAAGQNPGVTGADLISAISLLPHDYHDLNTLLEQREHSGRQEKLTSVILPEALTMEEIKEVLKEYAAESPSDERVTHHAKGNDQIVANIKYSEIDYGKTRLVQRMPKEAGIEFHIEKDKTVIRMPANDRIKGVFGKLKDKLDIMRKQEIPAIRIEIGEFESPALRTEFFTSLISDLKGFSLKNVTSVKVERLKQEPEEGELDLDDDQDTEEAKQEALALVKKVALKGETLLASEEYQSLSKKGFFITSIIWRSMLAKPPYPMIEIEAAFEEPVLGKGFKYFVRGAYNVVDKQYTKTIRPVDAEDKEKYLSIIEDTASNTIKELRKKALAEADEGQDQGDSA